MLDFFSAIAENPFLRAALFAGIAAAIAGGVVGAYVVIKRIVFISGSIAHSVLGGIGFCLWLQRAQGVLWAKPIYGALVAALISAWIMGWIHLKYREREDTVIAAVWSIGMAVGVLFISQTPGFNVELANFLVGNILWTSWSDLYILLFIDVLVIAVVFCFRKCFLTICFDEDQAYLQGLSVPFFYLLLLTLIAVTVVLLIHVVGIILVITLLTIPPTLANLSSHRLSHIMILAVFIGVAITFVGTLVSYQLNTPAGSTIALLAGLFYLLQLVLKSRKERSKVQKINNKI